MSATLTRRLGLAPSEPGSGNDGGAASATSKNSCPDIWELSNGDVAVIGRDLTEVYQPGLPADVRVGEDERLVVVPGAMFAAAKKDVPGA